MGRLADTPTPLLAAVQRCMGAQSTPSSGPLPNQAGATGTTGTTAGGGGAQYTLPKLMGLVHKCLQSEQGALNTPKNPLTTASKGIFAPAAQSAAVGPSSVCGQLVQRLLGQPGALAQLSLKDPDTLVSKGALVVGGWQLAVGT